MESMAVGGSKIGIWARLCSSREHLMTHGTIQYKMPLVFQYLELSTGAVLVCKARKKRVWISSLHEVHMENYTSISESLNARLVAHSRNEHHNGFL